MKNKLTLPFLLFLFLLIPPFANGQKMSADDVIAKHLASIGPADKRTAIKSLVAVGEVKVEFVTQKNQPTSGRIVIASDGEKMFLGMNLNASDYPQEQFVFDGSKTAVANIRSGSRSVLGNFIKSNTAIISQGLLAGTLKTSWALIDAQDKGFKITMSGNKKINGKEAYALRFSPKGGSDVDITMFFDQKTFHHVRTEYKRTSSASIGRTIEESSRQSETQLSFIEDFSDYKDFHGISLPHKYKLLYTVSGANGTTEVIWTCNLSEFAINQALDPASFQTGN